MLAVGHSALSTVNVYFTVFGRPKTRHYKMSLFACETKMLDRLTYNPSMQPEGQDFKTSEPASVDFFSVLGILMRRWVTIVAVLFGSVAIGTAFLLVTPPWYVGKSNLLLDTRKLQLFEKQSVVGEVNFDSPIVDSQIELLKSDAVALAVVQDLKLTEDPEFSGQGASFFGSLMASFKSLFTAVLPGPEEALQVSYQEETVRAAVEHLLTNLQVRRIKQTYVIEIGFNSLDPGKAAGIANAVATAYIVDQTQARQFTTQRAVTWLEQRMNELREQAIAADRVAQDFKTKNNIIQTGGRSIDEQGIGQLGTEFVNARSQTAEAKARLVALQEAIESGTPEAIMTDTLQNEVLSKLRGQYVDASKRMADFTSRFGPTHLAVVNLKTEMQRIRNTALEELQRIAQGYRSNFELAQNREDAVKARFEALTQQHAGTRNSHAALQALESAATAYRTLHESFLQRYVEASQQQSQSFTNTEARIITPAVRAKKVYPLSLPTMGLAVILGLGLGATTALTRERMNRVFRSPKQVEQSLGIACLGVLPGVEPPSLTLPKKQSGVNQSDERAIDHDLGIARQVVLTPFSRFTETVRSLKVAIDTVETSRPPRVIGMVSAVPGEGKTTLSANLAQLMAHNGKRTLLIDGDLRRPSLSKLMAPNAAVGLLEVLSGSIQLGDAIWCDPLTHLEFLPSPLSEKIAHTSEIIGSEKMKQFLQQAKDSYDYIVIDLPPLAPVVDARAAGHLIDAFILVIKWGRTSPEVITESLASAEVVQSKMLGAVLNRANSRALKRLEAYKGYSYHSYYN